MAIGGWIGIGVLGYVLIGFFFLGIFAKDEDDNDIGYIVLWPFLLMTALGWMVARRYKK